MKQNITKKQLNKLSEKGKDRLRDWESKKTGSKYYLLICAGRETEIVPIDLPKLSIGEMIEFLDEQVGIGYPYDSWIDYLYESDINHDIKPKFDEELCDALWECVKSELEK